MPSSRGRQRVPPELSMQVGCMLLVAFVVNPLLVFWKIRRNPYPLVLENSP